MIIYKFVSERERKREREFGKELNNEIHFILESYEYKGHS